MGMPWVVINYSGVCHSGIIQHDIHKKKICSCNHKSNLDEP